MKDILLTHHYIIVPDWLSEGDIDVAYPEAYEYQHIIEWLCKE